MTSPRHLNMIASVPDAVAVQATSGVGAASPGAGEREQLVIGLDLGGTKLHGAIGTIRGRVLAETVVGTRNENDGAAIEQLVTMSRDLAQQVGARPGQVAQIAVGVPGVVAADGRVTLSPHVHFAPGTSLSEALTQATGLPVFVANDVNIAAFGEFSVRQVASGMLVFVSLGTGIGMGLIADGKILTGASGAAGEIGTLPFGPDPAAAFAANPGGAYEATVSTKGIIARYVAAGARTASVREIFERADAGDPIASAVVDASLRDLAIGLGTVVALFDPGVIVLGGGIGSRPGLAEAVGVWLRRLVPTACAVVSSSLGHRAGVMGALAQARQLAIDASNATAPSATMGEAP